MKKKKRRMFQEVPLTSGVWIVEVQSLEHLLLSWYPPCECDEIPLSQPTLSLSTVLNGVWSQSGVPPTLTERPNRLIPDLRFTLTDPRIRRVCQGKSQV